jgi:hypothetical protein
MARTNGRPDFPVVIRAQRFEAVGSDGTVRGALGVEPDGRAIIDLYSPKGEVVIHAEAHPDGSSSLHLVESEGKGGVMVTMTFGVAGVQLTDKTGSPRASLAVRPDGQPSLEVFDANGNVAWEAP